MGSYSLRAEHCTGSISPRKTPVSPLPHSLLSLHSSLSIIIRIAWPITFDQPANSSYLSLTLDVAFELIQVRTGKNGMKPLYRECVQPVGSVEAVVLEVQEMLQRVGGEEGATKRRNAEEVRDRFRRAWEVGGTGLEDFKRLLQDVTKDVQVSI
jgi:hypothetical protein